jgi:tRNA (cytidine/uridine-2'-O-)-methyltransferase
MSTDSPLSLPAHQIFVALLHPQIAPNTGNIARLCVASGCALHLVRPLGFVLSDRNLRRSAMDYWPRLRLKVHDDDETFFTNMRNRRLWYFDSAARQSLWDVTFADGDGLVFGSESRGIDPAILNGCAAQCVRIPQVEGERCLNLSTSAGIVVYEAMRQLKKIAHQPDADSFIG